MIYYTGDIHGDPYEVIQFCDSKKLTEQDTLVLLGDVGANYYRNRRDTEMKRVLAAVKPTMLCIHGNHEIRPASIPSYRTKQWNGGTVWVSGHGLHRNGEIGKRAVRPPRRWAGRGTVQAGRRFP